MFSSIATQFPLFLIIGDDRKNMADSITDVFFKKDNELFYYDQELLIEYKLDLENLLIKDFFVINQSLYIYDSEHFIKYQIQKK